MANHGKIKCTFPECFGYFSSEKEMRKHKRHNREHDYCAVCDKDYLEWDEYSAHNAMYSGRDSNKKSVKDYLKAGEPVPSGNKLHMYGCAKCGELFKTESGRQRHTDGVSIYLALNSITVTVSNKLPRPTKSIKISNVQDVQNTSLALPVLSFTWRKAAAAESRPPSSKVTFNIRSSSPVSFRTHR